MSPDEDPASVRLGAIGLGGFARFALQHFVQVPGVELVCVGGASSQEAIHCADRYGLEVLPDAQAVCDRDDVNWVYINTPPFLHAEQTRMAVQAGKNVLVEKPLATNLDDAERIRKAAEQKGVRVVTNLMQRHNPAVVAIKRIIDGGWLGSPLFFNFNNHAVDQGLPTEHWFWDREKSGGIFVEHGVHFFDLAEHWFGPGQILSAGSARRQCDGVEDQVWCDARFGPTVARFYHGFNQTSRTESQRWEIVFERGQITSQGWIPMGFDAVAIVDEAETRSLMSLDENLRCRIVEQYDQADRQVRGHGMLHQVYQKLNLRLDPPDDKSGLYGDLLVDLMTYQIAERSPARADAAVNNDKGGYDSLRLACEARRMAS